MSCLGLVLKHLPGSTAPLAQAAPYYILLELSDQESEQHANAAMEQLLQHLLEAGLISDAAIAGSLQTGAPAVGFAGKHLDGAGR